MRITEFSQATGLTPRVLRRHHRLGHLVPAAVDPVTGYRRYDARQVEVARRLVALTRTGMDAAEAAELAHDPRPDVLAAHLLRVEDDLALLRSLLSTRSASPEVWILPAISVLMQEATVGVHGVAERVRTARRELRSQTGRRPAAFAAEGRAGSDAPASTSVHVELLDPRWTGEQMAIRIVVPWAAGLPAPAGWHPRHLRARTLSVVAVGELAGASLVDVLHAHRALALADPVDSAEPGRLWQLYDTDIARLWVSRERAARTALG